MTITLLSQEDYYAYLSKPHNPPAADVTKAAFDQEYDALYDRVEAIMSEHGENNAYGEGDYYLEPAISQSRGLGLEVENAAIVTESLVRRLQALLSRYAPAWEIYLGSSQYDFGVFIGPDSVRMHRNDESILPQLSEFIVDDAS